MTILDSMSDPQLFGRWFAGPTWNAWRVFLAAVFGLPMNAEQLAVYRQHTGRKTAPAEPVREAWVVAGRRAGKSRIAALVAVFLGCFRDYREALAPGEAGTVMILAADRRQARVVMRYITGFLDGVPMLRRMVANETRETIELTNHVVIEVHTASFRSTRGYTIIGAVADELAFWRSDESTNPDTEIVNAIRPGMATVPGALLLAISSPYSRRGELWRAYKDHFGKNGDPVLVWQADTRAMNPTVSEHVIAAAYDADAAAAAAEYGASFRRDIESFVSQEIVDACMISDRHELPPVGAVCYHGFVDPSGGSKDSMTLAIAHAEDGRAVLDLVRERKPPFDPDRVAAEFAATLKSYRLASVQGDRYGGTWPAERFAAHGIQYRPAGKVKSDIYGELLPLLNARRVELLDHPRMLGQLCNLERKTGRGGRDSIDHSPHQHDDVINGAAGALLAAHAAARHPPVVGPIAVGVRPSPWSLREWWS